MGQWAHILKLMMEPNISMHSLLITCETTSNYRRRTDTAQAMQRNVFEREKDNDDAYGELEGK